MLHGHLRQGNGKVQGTPGSSGSPPVGKTAVPVVGIVRGRQHHLAMAPNVNVGNSAGRTLG